MEFLKSFFGDGALTYEQLAEKLTAGKVNIADISGGAYVGREKFTALETERNGLKEQLEAANGKINEFTSLDIDGIKQAADEWKQKHEADTAALKAELAERDYSYTVKEATAGMKFSSESAKKAFLADLNEKKLPLQEGKVLGLDDFIKGYQETDPGAFLQEDSGKIPLATRGTGGAPKSDNLFSFNFTGVRPNNNMNQGKGVE